jgi:hypothetical protein
MIFSTLCCPGAGTHRKQDSGAADVEQRSDIRKRVPEIEVRPALRQSEQRNEALVDAPPCANRNANSVFG